jgi:hypothetical protein
LVRTFERRLAGEDSCWRGGGNRMLFWIFLAWVLLALVFFVDAGRT